jgi:hypothetical protein
MTEALYDHLTADLKDGGHGLTEASRTVVWDATEEFHIYDHTAGTWFSDALLHAHDELSANAP